jgi:RHS repeat-associated protein
LDGRTVSVEGYRYGYQGSEKDNEFKGEGNSYTTEFRQYDPRIGRWLSLDPKTHHEYSPYSAFDNNPIYYVDPEGADSEGENKNDLNKNEPPETPSPGNADLLNETPPQDGEKKSLSSLGMSKSKTVEENVDIITSDKMEDGDYFEGSDVNFLHPSASKAVSKLTKVDDNKFAVEDTWLADYQISEDATIKFVKGSVELTKKVDEKWIKEKTSGYWIYLHGMELDGYSKFFLDGDKLYIKKEDGTMKYFKNLK